MFSIFKKEPTEKKAAVIVPRVKHLNFLKAMNEIPNMTEESMPINEPLVGDLVLTYAIDIGPSYISASQSTLQEHGIEIENLRSLAEVNAIAALSNIQTRTDGNVYELIAPENMAACSILFPELWDQIEREIGGPVVVAFPHRDFVLYARADMQDKVEALQKVVGTIDFNETHALSKLLYRRVNGEWHASDS